MRNASGRPNVYVGTLVAFTVSATGVSLKLCEKSWSSDKEEGKASHLREASGLAAVVAHKTQMPLRIAAENCNTFLIRELGYKRQFDRYDDDDKYLAYLWGEPTEGRVAVYGACCFRWRQYEKTSSHAMQWIWLHPYARGRGHLAAAWPYFRERFGSFVVEPPYSKAMQAFLDSRKHHQEVLKQHRLIE